MAFTTLAHHIDIEWMRTAHGHTRKDGAVGVDGQTAEEYEVNLESNLQDLLDREANFGTYVMPPVRQECTSPRQAHPMRLARSGYQRMKIKFFSVRC